MSTKTITTTVEFCDHCGQKAHPFRCSLCGIEICEVCSDVFRITIQRSSAHILGSMVGWGSATVQSKFSSRYCPECAIKLTKTLREFAMLESLDQREFAAVMDGTTK